MSKHIRIASAALALSLLAAPVFAADAAAPAVPPATAAEPAGDPVIARINGEDIKASDFRRELMLLGPQAQQVPMQMLYPELLQKMIATKVVSAQGYAEKMQNDPEVKAQMKDAEAQIVAQVYVRKTIQPKISEAKIKERYDQLSAKFKPQDEVHARHILMPTEAEAQDIIKQLKGGADFAKLAKEKSRDTGSAQKGGDLGFFTRDVMVKQFADAAFAMKPGELTEKPVKTEFGYHVIKVEEKRKSSPPPMTQVHDQIAGQIGQEMTNELVKGLEAKAKIERFNIDGTPLKTAAAPAKPAK